MHSIAILDDYQAASTLYADWTALKDQASITVFRDTVLDEKELVHRLQPFDIISTMRERTKFDASLLAQLPNLKFLTTTAMRNRGIDVKAANDRNILVSGTSATSNSTMEHIWALILSTVRFVAQEHAATKSRDPQWQRNIPVGLDGKVMGLVGLGRLGQATAKIAKVFGMKVVAWSPHLTKERADAAEVDFASTKVDLFKMADIVSIHMVLSRETRGLVTLSELSLMKPSAFIINTSRGPLIEEDALIKVLAERSIAGAGLDVFDVEPLPLDHPLRSLPNVTLTPHMGYVADDAYKVWWQQTVENIEAYIRGEPIRLIRP